MKKQNNLTIKDFRYGSCFMTGAVNCVHVKIWLNGAIIKARELVLGTSWKHPKNLTYCTTAQGWIYL